LIKRHNHSVEWIGCATSALLGHYSDR